MFAPWPCRNPFLAKAIGVETSSRSPPALGSWPTTSAIRGCSRPQALAVRAELGSLGLGSVPGTRKRRPGATCWETSGGPLHVLQPPVP